MPSTAIGTSTIAFGLVNVPVRVYTATENHDVRFHLVHADDGGQIRYDRICTVCGKSVSFVEIDRAYQSPGGIQIIVTDEHLAQLPAAERNEIPVLAFVPSEQIDPMLLSRSYFLEPAAATPRAYVLLVKTLAKVDRTAVVLFTLRQKTRLAVLRVRDGVLVLQTLLWPDEVRPTAALRSLGVEANAPTLLEIRMARALVESMAGDFDPAEYATDYQIELKKLLVATAAGGRTIAAPQTVEPDREVDDLVAALQRSFEQATKPD